MADILFTDTRLRLATGATVALAMPLTYVERLQVSESMPLILFVSTFLEKYRLYGTFRKLVIAAHGETFTGRVSIQFCREGLDRHTVAALAPLRGKVRKIKLLSCQAASATAGGDEFCAALARATGAYVRAARENQLINTDTRDRWEGQVVTYNSEGVIVNEDEFSDDYLRD